ncbi:MAG: pantetheine-phosphate adenylyltransferase [Clostridia bacterium]|nr:pantetheine-phosphate adenylyltransferase [Clostridia bacterium]
MKCFFPGSFDPITAGHLDLIERAAVLFDQVVVGIGVNPGKKEHVPSSVRADWIRRCTQHMENVEVQCYEGLTVLSAKEIGADVMVRGLRSLSDFEAERTLSQVNLTLASQSGHQDGMETLFLMTRPEHGHISSSVVREMAMFSRSLRGYVPECIREEVERAYRS